MSGRHRLRLLIYLRRNMPTQRKPSRNKGVPVNRYLAIRSKDGVEIWSSDRGSMRFRAAGSLILFIF
jgi:hypothetical protein